MSHPDSAAESSAVSPEAQPAQEETAVGPAALPERIPHAGPRYAVLRLVVLVAVGGVLYVIGIRGWDLAFVAVLVSGIISLFLFRKQRNDVAVNLGARPRVTGRSCHSWAFTPRRRSAARWRTGSRRSS
ncbi:MAG: DUF4229 domain-containing protein [Candidatus Nanopelagicales bacterium]